MVVITPPSVIHPKDEAFRRGRMLTLIMVTTTAFTFSEGFIRDLLRYGRIPFSAIFDSSGLWVLMLLAWLGLRGGRIMTVFLTLANAMVSSVFATCVVGAAIRTLMPGAYWPFFVRTLAEFDGSRASNYFVIEGVLATFSLWVLLISKDVRLYRRMNRRQIVETEANAFEWPPPHRRQG